jgi:AraC-like DNA-binding protein
MDALSAVLKSVRLEGAVFLNAEFTAPWCIRAKHGLSSIRRQLPGADSAVSFHFIADGECKVRVDDGEESFDVNGGDLVLFPHDDTHMLGSDLDLKPVDYGSVLSQGASKIRHGGGGRLTRSISGYLGYNRSLCGPIFDGLPRVVRVPGGNGQTASLLRDLLRIGVRESLDCLPGGQSMLTKLSELMFVEALRRYADTLPPERKGCLAGVRDPHVGRALALFHEDPRRPWTVDELAREVALSRSALAERFTALVGESPIQYLKRWRLALAAQVLRSGQTSIARVAESSGYDSESAFTRAFKREIGMPPAAWRRISTATNLAGTGACTSTPS